MHWILVFTTNIWEILVSLKYLFCVAIPPWCYWCKRQSGKRDIIIILIWKETSYLRWLEFSNLWKIFLIFIVFKMCNSISNAFFIFYINNISISDNSFILLKFHMWKSTNVLRQEILLSFLNLPQLVITFLKPALFQWKCCIMSWDMQLVFKTHWTATFKSATATVTQIGTEWFIAIINKSVFMKS